MSRKSDTNVSQREVEKSMDKEYIAILLIEILFEKGLVNQQTYINAKKRMSSHISHTALSAVK
mgnify:CR=1 FL=1